MDSNKDEGLWCMRIVKNVLELGDKVCVLRFLKMVKCIYFNFQVDVFLWELVEGEELIVVKKFDSEMDFKQQVGIVNGIKDGEGRVNGMF